MATRKSTRVVNSSNDGPAKDEDHQTNVGDNSEEEGPKKKTMSSGRKRGANDSAKQPPTKRRRGNQGLLKDVVDMPLDIVFEIFGKLFPTDLLNLSRTSKDLRNILLSRSSVSVWKDARNNVLGLPDCPPDLSEPQYADLCFTKHCTTCLRSRIASTYHIWSARVRLCKSCLEEECASNTWGLPFELMDHSMYQMMPCLYITPPGRPSDRPQCYYHTASIAKWVTKFTSATNDDEKVVVKQEIETIHKHGQACRGWFAQYQVEIEAQKRAAINQRGDVVVEYAKKIGWTDEFILSPGAPEVLKQDDTVRKACVKDVTERVLNNLEGTINEVLEGVRVDRISSAVDALLKKRVPLLKKVVQQCQKTLSPNQAIPTTRQLLEMPSVRDLVLNTSDVEMNIAHFQPVVDNFVTLTGEWQARTRKSLVDLINKGYGTDHPTVDESTILDLATTVFVCSGCSRDLALIGYPRALSHVCNTRSRISYGGDKVVKVLTPLEQAEDKTLRNILNESPWNHYGRLAFRPELSAMLGDIIELCGFKRATTTRAEMDAANPVFECLACHSGSLGRVVMTWWSTIHHWRDKHTQDYHFCYHQNKMKLRVIEDAKEAELLRQELITERERQAARTMASVCAQCHIEDTSYNVKIHWKKAHGRTAVGGDVLPKYDSDFRETYNAWPPRDDDEHKTIPGTEIAPITPTKSKDGYK